MILRAALSGTAQERSSFIFIVRYRSPGHQAALSIGAKAEGVVSVGTQDRNAQA